MKTGRYPNLSQVVAAGISIFHGPLVESSFSVMNNVMDATSNRINVQTYAAIQNIKYALRAKKMSAIQYLKRKDVRFSPVHKNLCQSIRSAGCKYNKQKQERAKARSERQEKFQLHKTKPVSKQQARLDHEAREKEA